MENSSSMISSQDIADLKRGEPLERARKNSEIARKFLALEDFAKAKVFSERAWFISMHNLEFADLHFNIVSKIGSIQEAKAVLKQAIWRAARDGKIDNLLVLAQRFQHYAVTVLQDDVYEYDFEVLHHIKTFAQYFAPQIHSIEQEPRLDGKKRIAYLLYGADQKDSAIMRVAKYFLKNHDRDKFHITAIIMRDMDSIMGNETAKDNYNWLLAEDIEVINVNPQAYLYLCYVNVAEQIRRKNIDILITMAGMTDMSEYFMQCLKPAAKTVSMVYAHQAIFCNPEADLALIPYESYGSVMVANTRIIKLSYEPPQFLGEKISRSDLEIPEDAIVLMSGGRDTKYRNDEFWNIILQLMEKNSNVWFLGIGLQKSGKEYSGKLFPKELQARCVFSDWSSNYFRYLELGDIFMESFPSGSGLMTLDAMYLGKAVTALRAGIYDSFHNYSWRPAETYVPDECVFAIEDLSKYAEAVSKWTEDKELLQKISDKCGKALKTAVATPLENTRILENFYLELLG